MIDPERFRVGVDGWPDWAWNHVNTNEIIIRGESWGPLTQIEICKEHVIKHGDMLSRKQLMSYLRPHRLIKSS